MTTVDHANLDRLEAQSRRDHQTARQALAATDRQTLAAAPPPVTLRLVVEITNPDEPNRMLWSERLAEAIEAAGLPCGYFTITEP